MTETLSDKIQPVRGRFNMSSQDVREAVKKLKERKIRRKLQLIGNAWIEIEYVQLEDINEIFGEKLIN